MGRNADDLGAVFGIWGKETAVDNFVLSGPGFHVDEGGLVTLLEPSRHQHGLAVVGLFTHEIAESKVKLSMLLAKEAQMPLRFTFEAE